MAWCEPRGMPWASRGVLCVVLPAITPCCARCRALRPTHSAGRPTEGPRPTPWSRILDQQIRQRGACVVSHSQRVLHILNGPTLLHAAASCCVDSTYHQVRSSPACLLSPDRRTRILRRVAPDQLALHLHLVPCLLRCRLLHAPSHLLALPPSQRPGDDAVVLQVHHPDARPGPRFGLICRLAGLCCLC